MKAMKLLIILPLIACAGALSAAETKAQTDGDLEARLAAARERLQEAAREVGELSAQIGGRVVTFGGGLPHGVIGLQLDPASGKDGARVAEVSPGGPAAEAGIRVGDVIAAVNGAPVKGENTARQVVDHMREMAADSTVKLRVMRDGKPLELQVNTRPAFALVWSGPGGGGGGAVRIPPPGVLGLGPLPDLGSLRALDGEIAGMELATLTPTLGQYFGTDKGVLVVRAPRSGDFHLQDGDVILAIDGREPRDGSHATRILRSYQAGEKIGIKIMRQKKQMSLQVTLPETAEYRSASID
jgi:S1-C subfamily serine protease